MEARSYKLTLEYDGTDYRGWQVQAEGKTIQAELQKALSTVLRREVKATASGRTDAGVHARGQVVSLEAQQGDPEADRLRGSLNGLLPEAIRVSEAEWAPGGFDARRDAMGKTYRYVFWNRRAASPFWDRWSWHVGPRLDLETMQKAASHLVGKHDFSSFRAAECSAAHPNRDIYKLELKRDGDRVVMEVSADAFLHHMVRNLAGTLYEVGLGKRPADSLQGLLQARDRSLAGETAPARGLCLWQVQYGEIPRPKRKNA